MKKQNRQIAVAATLGVSQTAPLNPIGCREREPT